MKPLVGIIMGSQSDWDTMRAAAETLEQLGVAHEVRVVSAHRTPDLLFEYASTARTRGLANKRVRICVMMNSSLTALPNVVRSPTINSS